MLLGEKVKAIIYQDNGKFILLMPSNEAIQTIGLDEIIKRDIPKNTKYEIVDDNGINNYLKTLEPNLDELKQAKLSELASWVRSVGDDNKINLKGFGVINGGYRPLLNVEALINDYDAMKESERVFRMHDNSFTPVSKQQLLDIQTAIGRAGRLFYKKKWLYEAQISAAKSKEELDRVVFDDLVEIDLSSVES